MEVQIANPIYDVVFKYMMEDNLVARLLVSSIIGEQIVELETRPQERTTEKTKKKSKKDSDSGNDSSFTVYRLDFSAKIKTPEGYKLIIIELQKASVPDDLMRFRLYMGKQYSDVSNSIIGVDGKREPIQIYAIYFLGKDLEMRDTPVLSVNPDVRDVATQEKVEGNNKFIEGLNHRCWIVQISCLKQRRRNELEMLLSIFDQENRTSDIHILNVREGDFPEKYRPVIRRLKLAASSAEVKKQMEDEDEHLRYLQDIERGAHYQGEQKGLAKGLAEGRAEGRAEGEAIGLEKGEAIGLKKGEVERDQLKAELKASKENMVISCHKSRLPVETISNITGLTDEQVIEILKRHGLM